VDGDHQQRLTPPPAGNSPACFLPGRGSFLAGEEAERAHMSVALPTDHIDRASPFGDRARRRRLAGTAARALWTAPVVFGLLLTTVYPTLFLIALALTKSSLGKPFRAFVGLKQIGSVLVDPLFQASVVRSILFAVGSSLAELALGLAIALLFVTLIRAGRFFTSLVLLPLMTPPVMVGVAWKLILAPAGGLLNGILLNLGVVASPISFLGTPTLAWISILVADLWQWTPLIVILSFAALLTIPGEVREAALIDGAGAWQRFRHITLPLVAGPLASIFLLKLIIAFKLFDLVYVLTFGGPGFATTTTGFAIWRLGLEQFDVGRAAAETLVYAAIVGVATLPVVRLHRKIEGILT
jgi:multiple sugar transport system permease protein